jgi:hypothetical protein
MQPKVAQKPLRTVSGGIEIVRSIPILYLTWFDRDERANANFDPPPARNLV